jgi:uncharacterized Ntn-hydrolase superfamily protein
MTYSIVALDPVTGELGCAVQSRWPGVGSDVPWVEPGVGVVATQSFSEPGHGFNGLRLMREGRTAPEALAAVLAPDADEAVRQVGIVDAAGRSAAHTGLRSVRYASHLVAPGVSVQANMMERPTVPAAMLAAFTGTDGELADRLMAALRAAEREGGDVRGRQAAALVVAPGTPGSPPWARRFDLRVDDHPAPLDELARLLRLARGYAAMDEAERAMWREDAEAGVAAGRRSVALAPDDDQVRLWSAVWLAVAGRMDEARAAYDAAAAAEPRSAEILRRFAEAGHLPGGERALEILALS